MDSFMASLLEGDDTRRARGHENIKGKPVSTDPLAPVRDRADKPPSAPEELKRGVLR
jgi:hypothetical protein